MSLRSELNCRYDYDGSIHVSDDARLKALLPIKIGFRYIFEPYRLNDFQWNSLNTYPFENLPAEQQFPTTRPLLLDSRYSSHNAHVFSVYLRFQKGRKAE